MVQYTHRLPDVLLDNLPTMNIAISHYKVYELSEYRKEVDYNPLAYKTNYVIVKLGAGEAIILHYGKAGILNYLVSIRYTETNDGTGKTVKLLNIGDDMRKFIDHTYNCKGLMIYVNRFIRRFPFPHPVERAGCMMYVQSEYVPQKFAYEKLSYYRELASISSVQLT